CMSFPANDSTFKQYSRARGCRLLEGDFYMPSSIGAAFGTFTSGDGRRMAFYINLRWSKPKS
ncbi:MAG: hypothetical protein LH481_06840, partial [Burkholderiales bacterium]|nr:hypothetical protein [Burkholderiales bacterium]